MNGVVYAAVRRPLRHHPWTGLGGRGVRDGQAHHHVDGLSEAGSGTVAASGCRAAAWYPTDPGQILFATGNGTSNTDADPGNTPPRQPERVRGAG